MAVGPSAAADMADDGRWWVDTYGIEDFHDQGIDGAGVTIAVIDGSINPQLPEFEGADITVHEPSYCYGPGGVEQPATSTDVAGANHGSNVAALIVGNGQGYSGPGVLGVAPGAKLLYYSVNGEDDGDCYDAEGRVGNLDVASAVAQAVTDGADIISVSLGSSNDMDQEIAAALRSGVVLVGALSNQDVGDWEIGFAISNGVVSVAAVGPDGNPQEDALGPLSSRYTDVVAPGIDILLQGDPNGGWEDQRLGDGTSMATPITAGNIALAMQKYPQATSNQVIQSLIHNTGVDPHPLEYDTAGQYGYGAVDTISLLAADPTQYEDVNPLLSDDVDSLYFEGPTIAEIYGDSATADPSPSSVATAEPSTDAPSEPSSTANAAPDDATGDSRLVPIAIIVALVVLVAVSVTVIIVVARNRKKETPHGNV